MEGDIWLSNCEGRRREWGSSGKVDHDEELAEATEEDGDAADDITQGMATLTSTEEEIKATAISPHQIILADVTDKKRPPFCGP